MTAPYYRTVQLHMAGKLRLLLLVLFVASSDVGPSAYGNEIVGVTIGSVAIAIPPPLGFFRIDGKGGKTDRLLQATIPPDNRLLAMFGSERALAEVLSDRIPQGSRTFSAQVTRSVEQENIPREVIPMFAAKYRETAINAKLKTYVDEAAATASSKLAAQLKTDARFKIGESIYLGVFDETPHSVATSSLLKVQMQGVEGVSSQPAVAVVATVTLLVRNRLVLLFCTAPYRSGNDFDSVRRSILQWRDVVADANSSSQQTETKQERFNEVKAKAEAGDAAAQCHLGVL